MHKRYDVSPAHCTSVASNSYFTFIINDYSSLDTIDLISKWEGLGFFLLVNPVSLYEFLLGFWWGLGLGWLVWGVFML